MHSPEISYILENFVYFDYEKSISISLSSPSPNSILISLMIKMWLAWNKTPSLHGEWNSHPAHIQPTIYSDSIYNRDYHSSAFLTHFKNDFHSTMLLVTVCSVIESALADFAVIPKGIYEHYRNISYSLWIESQTSVKSPVIWRVELVKIVSHLLRSK